MDLSRARIAVTGAAGVVGAAVAARVRDAGARVTGADRAGGTGVEAVDTTRRAAPGRRLRGDLPSEDAPGASRGRAAGTTP